MNQSVNDKAVCRTALATPGLLSRQDQTELFSPLHGLSWCAIEVVH